MEFLDIVDENGEPSGGIIDRETAHLKGIRHRTSHLWLLRRRGDSVQILLQKRAENKASYPACYDISSAGHIPAGCGYVPSALRELKEELGADAQADELICIGSEAEFSLQKEEVDSVRWMDFDECFESVSNNTIRHCIAVEELMMIKEYLKNGGDMLWL